MQRSGKRLYVLQKATAVLDRLSADPDCTTIVVSLGSSKPSLREALVRKRLVSHDIVPFDSNTCIERAILVPSVLTKYRSKKNSASHAIQLYDLIFCFRSGFDARRLAALQNNALISGGDYAALLDKKF